MDARSFSTKAGQNWRVTGIRDGDAPGMVPHVSVEFWIGEPGGRIAYRRMVPDTLDPSLARLLAKHLNEMADHAEETT